jgi:anthranilate synthase component 1
MRDTAQKTKDSEQGGVTAVVDTLPADLLTPLAVYLKLSANEINSFLLESVEGGESLARYSFVGAGPVAIISGTDKHTVIENETGSIKQPISVFEYLREHFSGCEVADHDELPSFAGGAIGYMDFLVRRVVRANSAADHPECL